MVHGVGLFLAARGMRAVLVLWVAAVAVVVLTAKVVMPVDLAFFEPARDIPLIELASVVFGCVAVALACPRMTEWEKLGAARVAALSALLVVVLVALAVAAAMIGVTRLPGGVPWQYIPGNIAVLVAAAALACAVIGPTAGATVCVTLFFACCVVQNTLPRVAAALPLSQPGAPPLPAVVPLLALAVAVAATAWNRGMTMWAHARNRD